jgi:hypothetical protein
MNNDLFSLSEVDFNDVISNPGAHFLYYKFDGRDCARHVNNGPLSPSKKVDKKIFENIRRDLRATGNKAPYQGNFNGGDIRNFIDPHLKKTYILKIDLKSFYNSIGFSAFEQVAGADYPDLAAIKSIYFSPNLLVGLAASSVIAEKFIQKIIDGHINTFIHKKAEYQGASYTRFYDDIYVSSDSTNMLEELKKSMAAHLKKHNLQFNEKKTRTEKIENSLILKRRVNKGQVNVGRRFKNNLRYQLHRHNPNTDTLEDTYRTIREVHAIIGKLSYIIRIETKPSHKWIAIYNEYMAALDEHKAVRDQQIHEGKV